MEKLENRRQPLAECYGYRINDTSAAAKQARIQRTCPYGNAQIQCTKVSVENPLAVCSLYYDNNTVVTCPVRFRENGIIYKDSADFFFPPGARSMPIREVGIADCDGGDAGNIDIVIAQLDASGRIIDFGALEVQSVYISGNVRMPFDHFIEAPDDRGKMVWEGQPKYPRPDWLSSTRKRLAPQLLYKGGILRSWNKKMAVVMDKHLFATMPTLPLVNKSQAEIAWFLYDLKMGSQGRYQLTKVDTKYTQFEPTLNVITKCKPGRVQDFILKLEEKRKRLTKAGKF